MIIKRIKKKLSSLNYGMLALLVFVIVLIFIDPIKNSVQLKVKEVSLQTFYKQLSSANDKFNWSAIYDYLPASTKKFVSRDQYISSMQKVNYYSRSTVIHGFKVIENKGIVSRTITTCLIQECTGDYKNITDGDIQYIYDNGQWIVPDTIPSEKSLEIVNKLYGIIDQNSKEKLQNGWGFYGVKSDDFVIYNYALYLDKNPSEVAKAENAINQYNLNQQKTVNIPAPVYHPVPLIIPPAPQIKTTHCTQDAFGGGISCTTY